MLSFLVFPRACPLEFLKGIPQNRILHRRIFCNNIELVFTIYLPGQLAKHCFFSSDCFKLATLLALYDSLAPWIFARNFDFRKVRRTIPQLTFLAHFLILNTSVLPHLANGRRTKLAPIAPTPPLGHCDWHKIQCEPLYDHRIALAPMGTTHYLFLM